jgi:hypothetical protein
VGEETGALSRGSRASAAGSNQGWGADIGALALLLAVVVLFFWPVISRQAWIPQGGGDLVSFVFPMYRFAAASLREGHVPLWNPFLYAGAPFVADNQSGLFYPFNLLLFILRPDFSYLAVEGLVIWHFFFAGAATYFCLRWFRPSAPISRAAALAGAFSFMLSGVFINHIGHLNLISVAAWLPLTFMAMHRANEARERASRLAWAIGSGAALGIGTLAGHGQATFLLGTFLGLYAVYRSISERSLWALLLLAVAGIVALATAAISLFPALESIRYTLRAEFDIERSSDFALPWRGLIGLFAPDYFGRGIANFWGGWARVEFGYMGVIPWFLACSALVIKPTRRQLFFALSVGLFLLLALGPHSPLYPLIFGRLPYFPFRVPARFLLLVDFSVAMLAAFGLDYLSHLRLQTRQARIILVGSLTAAILFIMASLWQANLLSLNRPDKQAQMLTSVAVFALFAAGSWMLIWLRLRQKLSESWFAWLAILWLAIDLIGLGRYVEIEWNDPTLGYPSDSPALRYLRADPGVYRIDVATDKWQPSLPQLEKLFAIGGVYNPLNLANYSVYIGSMGSRGSPLYNLLGVKYVIGDKSYPPGDTNIIVPVFDDDPEVTIYLNTGALPRAMLLYEAEVVADHDAAFFAVHSEAFDPYRTLILEEGNTLHQPAGRARISFLRYDPSYVLLDVSTDTPGYLLLTDIDHPHWQATDNGNPTQILTADYAFRAVWLEPGDHHVAFAFEPPGWKRGLIISGLTWLVIGIYLVWYKKRRR